MRNYCLLVMLAMTCWINAAQATLAWQPYEIVGMQKQVAKGGVAYIDVPENRLTDAAKSIKLGFVRLPSLAKKPGNPIVYLSGGPGGSATWTARHWRFPLFVKLTDIADVIVFDQRGTGLSRNDLKDCDYQPDISLQQPLTRLSYWRNMQAAMQQCQQQWRDDGIDLNGYNTLQSAHDLEALRVALGVEKIDLWATSYGTHLAFAMAKYYPKSIGRMVLSSAEGPDETVKLPARSDAHLQRVADELALDPAAKRRYPDLIGLMKRVIKQYRADPVAINVKDKGKVVIDDIAIQVLTAGSLTRDPRNIALLPYFYRALEQGDFSTIGRHFLAYRQQLWTFNPMSMAMDAASGISKSRWQQVQQQAQSSILWRASNLPFPDINRTLGVTDLAEQFRQHVKSDIPALFFSGTLDGRTFTESHRELANGFSNHTFVTVYRGGHNLFLSDPAIIKTMVQFYSGENVADFTIELAPILFK